MLQIKIPRTPTERVVARLESEGWVKCTDLGFAALCQQPTTDLYTFVLNQLQQADTWLWESDLQLATLIFSIPDHEFQVHPHLKAVLQHLESQGMIEVQKFKTFTRQGEKPERVMLRQAACVA